MKSYRQKGNNGWEFVSRGKNDETVNLWININALLSVLKHCKKKSIV